MDNQISDIIATINLFPTDSGGRLGPTPKETFNCLLVMDEKNFDVRIHLGVDERISPGQSARVSINFLDRGEAMKHCAVGKEFVLRELDTIGNGTIEELTTS